MPSSVSLISSMGEVETLSSLERLCKTLYVIHFLNNSFAGLNPPIVRCFLNNTRAQVIEKPPVLIKDPKTKRIMGPFQLIPWGRGYACVSTGSGPKEIPGCFRLEMGVCISFLSVKQLSSVN